MPVYNASEMKKVLKRFDPMKQQQRLARGEGVEAPAKRLDALEAWVR